MKKLFVVFLVLFPFFASAQQAAIDVSKYAPESVEDFIDSQIDKEFTRVISLDSYVEVMEEYEKRVQLRDQFRGIRFVDFMAIKSSDHFYVITVRIYKGTSEVRLYEFWYDVKYADTPKDRSFVHLVATRLLEN